MNKQTKLILGVGVVGVAAYLIWKSQQPKANATGCSSCNKSNASGIGTLTYNQMEDLGASLADIRRRKSQNRQIFK